MLFVPNHSCVHSYLLLTSSVISQFLTGNTSVFSVSHLSQKCTNYVIIIRLPRACQMILDCLIQAPWRCSVRKGVLGNFAKFTGKNLIQSLFFNKVAGVWPANLLEKRLWHRCFPVNFAKFSRTPFLQTTSGRKGPKFIPTTMVENTIKVSPKQKKIHLYLQRFRTKFDGPKNLNTIKKY